MSSFWKRFILCAFGLILFFGLPAFVVQAQTQPASGGGAASGGTCRFNCWPQVESSTLSCTQDSDCVRTCTDRCPTYVDRGACARDTARCVDLGGGRKGCRFDCVPQIEYDCTPGDGGTAECGRACNERCRPPASAGATATAVRCSALAPSCVPRGGSAAPPATGEEQQEGGGSGGGSVRITNPIRGADTIPAVIGKIVKGILGIVGALALLMFVYGGVLWILSAGDPKDVTKAKSVLSNAVIGLVLVLFSYGLSALVLGLIQEVGTSSGSSGSSSSSASNNPLAICVRQAVSARAITLNQARERTDESWSCRATTPEERARGSTTCIPRGCPDQAAEVLCCAPAAAAPAPPSPPPPRTATTPFGSPEE